MDEAVARRPIQNLHRIVLRDPSSQNLARLVPIDQENERDINRFEKEVANCRGLSGTVTSNQIKYPPFGLIARRMATFVSRGRSHAATW